MLFLIPIAIGMRKNKGFNVFIPAELLLLNVCCDAPFKVQFNTEQLRRSLP
jgi:hypothetical protein